MKEFCIHCFADHEPNPPDSYVDFNRKRYIPPFKCMCCGKEICGQQFAFGRCCGICDTGACQKYKECFHESIKVTK